MNKKNNLKNNWRGLKMAFMKKDVNLGLLVLIIVSIILFSGFTVYYQTAFRDISLEYETKLGQLNDVTKQLTESFAISALSTDIREIAGLFLHKL